MIFEVHFYVFLLSFARKFLNFYVFFKNFLVFSKNLAYFRKRKQEKQRLQKIHGCKIPFKSYKNIDSTKIGIFFILFQKFT